MKPFSLNYFPVRINQSAASVDFVNMDDLLRFIQNHQFKDIFIIQENDTSYFGIFFQNVLMRCSTKGFSTLEDYHNAAIANFPDSGVYYAAIALGYHNYEDYELVTEAGITDRNIFNKIKAGHFIEGYKDYCQQLQTDQQLLIPETFSNPYQLYTYATENGFAVYADFKKAISKGFTSADLLTIAESLGFDNYADYHEAHQKGFRNSDELALARARKVRDRQDLIRLVDLEFSGSGDYTFDKRLLLSLLSKLEQRKKISINKLKDLLKRSADEYRYPDTGEMPLWFTTSLETEEDIISFMQMNQQVKEYGSYDPDGEFFEIYRLEGRKVVIDGSNVAHNSSIKGQKPSVDNILKMVKHLKSKGFIDITVINDASLRHKVIDADKMQELREEASCLEAPRENPADVFIIQYVKKLHCLLVSNDTFREWKIQDAWTAENIDYYRLTFMIKGDEVLMPDLK
jgi:hypothetical protein